MTSVSERRVELIEVVPVELCYVSCNSSEAEAEREGHPSLLFLIALATDPLRVFACMHSRALTRLCVLCEPRWNSDESV